MAQFDMGDDKDDFGSGVDDSWRFEEASVGFKCNMILAMSPTAPDISPFGSDIEEEVDGDMVGRNFFCSN